MTQKLEINKYYHLIVNENAAARHQADTGATTWTIVPTSKSIRTFNINMEMNQDKYKEWKEVTPLRQSRY
jgi:hypothetical protein